MNILITGSSGFIGFNLINYLQKFNDYHISGCDNNLFGLNKPKLVRFFNKSFLELTKEDLFGYDVLIHLAATKKHNSTHDSLLISNNVTGTLHLFELAAESGVSHIIFASSLYAHGGYHSLNVKESDPCAPDTLYGISKSFAENSLRYISKEYNIICSIARLYFIYGPYQYTGLGYPSIFLRSFDRMSNNNNPIIVNDGEQRLDYLYIDDVCAGLIHLIDNPKANFNIYNFASSNAYSITQISEHICLSWNNLFNSNFTPIFEGSDFTAGTYRSGSNELLQKDYDWHPQIDISTGISKMLSWYLEAK